jgi:hypothetical protein
MPTPSDKPIPYAARAFNPAHPDLAMGAGVPARLAYEKYVKSLARIVYYWGLPAIDTMGRTSGWQLMKAPGATLGLFPGAPKNTMGYLDDYMPPAQRKVVTPNNDTIYGVCLFDLSADSLVLQTPTEAPKGHYWTIQIVDLFTTVTHQIGSASHTPGGKFLLVGPKWQGQKPDGFIDVLRSPTNASRPPNGARCSTMWRWQPTPSCTMAPSTTRSVSTPATAGSVRKTAAPGAPTGSGAHRPRSSTSTSTTSMKRSTSRAAPTTAARCCRAATPTR